MTSIDWGFVNERVSYLLDYFRNTAESVINDARRAAIEVMDNPTARRERFVRAALAGLCANPHLTDRVKDDVIAAVACALADETIRAMDCARNDVHTAVAKPILEE